MENASIIKIKEGKITLPKALQKEWGANAVIFMRVQDGVYLKPVSPTFSDVRPKLKKLGKILTKKNVSQAVAWAREKTYQGRA